MKRKFRFSPNDYTPSMLPQNRRQVFWDVFQLHWQKLLFSGVILLLFYLPLLLSLVVKDVYVANLYAAMEGQDDAARLQASQTLGILDLLRNGVNILFLIILAAGASGVLRILRQYAWGENVHFPTDFGRGIRDNYLHTAAIFAIGGILRCLCLGIYYTAPSYSSGLLSLLSLLPIGISLLVALPVLMIALVMVPVYRNTLSATVKNAFFIYTRCFWKVFAAAGCTLILWIISQLPDFYCHTIGSFFAIVLTPFAFLGWTLFCYDCFDRHLNPIVAPELIHKGIYKSK